MPSALASMALCAAAAVMVAGTADAQEKTMISLATATPGGGFPVYGDAYAAALNAIDPTLAIQTRNTKGSTENIPLIESGQVDIALATGEVTYEAIVGIGRAPGNLRIINAMYSQPGMFVVRADSPYRTIADLKGKPIAWGARGSGLVVLARYAMDGVGLDLNKDFEPHLLDKAGDGPVMVLEGKVAALWGGGLAWPGFNAVAKSPIGARLIAPTAEEISRITGKHTFIKKITLPANSYPGQTTAVESVGSWPFVLARTNLPDDVAYRLAKAIHRLESGAGPSSTQLKETTLANTLAAVPRQDVLHPGVLRYMREAGLVR